MLPVAVHAVPEATEHTIVVSAMLPGSPCRRVTLTVLNCCENTLNFVAVHPFGTQVNTEPASVALPVVFVTE
jgi:hypothetical protein